MATADMVEEGNGVRSTNCAWPLDQSEKGLPRPALYNPPQLACPRHRGSDSLSPTHQSQLFFEVTTKTFPGTNATFLLPHLGHFGFAASCCEMVSVRSNLFPHFSQRYWYVGIDFTRAKLDKGKCPGL
jgi:hypothetical protein